MQIKALILLARGAPLYSTSMAGGFTKYEPYQVHASDTPQCRWISATCPNERIGITSRDQDDLFRLVAHLIMHE